MNDRQFQQLLSKYLQGKSTPEEIELLHRFYDSFQKKNSEEPKSLGQWSEEKRIYLNIKQALEQRERQQYEAQRTKASRLRAALKMAASVLLIISLGIAGYVAHQTTPPPKIAWIQKRTQKGQKAEITLTDGTRVHLNADSRLSFPESFAADQRTVTLEGEAFFEVTRQPTRPFVITSGNLTTTVLGTSFNVKAFATEPLEVTVASGQVKVSLPNLAGTSSELLLNPYQQAFYDGTLSKKEVDIHQFIAWREKVIQFDALTLAEAVIVLERWFDVSIKINNEQARSCRISGRYVNENLTNVLESFAHILDISYRMDGARTITLKGKGCH